MKCKNCNHLIIFENGKWKHKNYEIEICKNGRLRSICGSKIKDNGKISVDGKMKYPICGCKKPITEKLTPKKTMEKLE